MKWIYQLIFKCPFGNHNFNFEKHMHCVVLITVLHEYNELWKGTCVCGKNHFYNRWWTFKEGYEYVFCKTK